MADTEGVDAKERLLEENHEHDTEEAERLRRNFVRMSVCYALNAACSTTVIAYAGADFHDIGNYSNGVLFGSYCITALFFGNVIITWLGLRRSLICGLSQYCVYLMMYLLAFFIGKTHFLSKVLIILGAATGGIASGYQWLAQGAYFQQTAKRYAKCLGKTEEEANGEFSSLFATCYLGFEITFKFAGAGIQSQSSMAMYLCFVCVGFASALGMATIDDLAAESMEPISCDTVMKKSSSAIRLLVADPKMALMLPYEMAFGFASAFLNSYISPKVVKPIIGKAAIGYFAGIVAGVACLVSAAGGAFIKLTGLKWPNMLIGAASFACMAGIFLVVDTENWDKKDLGLLVFLYCLQGVGRGIFESTNKAVIADFFGDQAPAAFANVVWSSGGASAFGYFVFPGMAGSDDCVGTNFDRGSHALCTIRVQAEMCFFMALAGIGCFFCALLLHSRRSTE